MASRSWQVRIADLFRRAQRRARGRRSFRPSLEVLEARTLPSLSAGFCATPGKDGTPSGPLSGVINTYYAGTATAAAGATSIQLGAARGATTTITPGDLLLVIQVQNATVDSSNSTFYGDGTGSGAGSLSSTAGTFEYVVATDSVGASGGALTFTGGGAGGGLANSYFAAAATALHGQETFEVVRVPQYVNATLGSTLTAAAWNGSTGGVLAVDVAGNLNLNSATVSVDGEGFRGGGGRQLTGSTSASSTDYVNVSTVNAQGEKGEGIAGTPEYVYDPTTGTVINTGQPFDGLPGGSTSRGAPGNAGGGGTDADVASNDQNTGGGGGGNGGAGGQGGYSWATALNLGGLGGVAYTPSAGQLLLGGGGGAGVRNNSPTIPAASSGGAGGGVVLIRAGSLSGTGTLTANGIMGVTPQNDGGPGGGAGGSVEVIVHSGSLAGLTVQAKGARGTDAFPASGPGSSPPPSSNSMFHGPGGGGGGGVVVLSSMPGSVDVSGGANGTTTTSKDIYGASPGQPGVVLLGATDTQVSGPHADFECTSDLAVTATGPASVLAGTTVTYTLTVTNNGPEDASNVSLTYSAPANTTLLGQSQTGGPAFTLTSSGNQITDTLATLASGDTATFQVQVQVQAGLAIGTVLSSTANVSTTNLDPYPANNSATAQTTIGPEADLAVNVSGPSLVNTGTDATYTVTVTNNGPNDAQNVTLTDPFPAGSTFVSQSQTSGPAFTLSNSASQVSDTIATLASGASATFQVVLQANGAAGSTLTDTATANSPTLDPNTANNTGSATTIIGPLSADLAVTTTAPSAVTAGTNWTYTVTVTNNGPTLAQNVSLADTLPAGSTLVSQTQTAGPAFTLGGSGGQVNDTIATLASGASATFQVTAAVPSSAGSGTTVTEQASVTSGTADPVSTNNSASASATVSTSADLSTVKFAPTFVALNSNFTYTITVFNSGPSDAQAVVMTDTLPSGVTFVSQSQSGGPTATLTNSGNAVSDTIPVLPPGQSATFLVVAHVPSTATVGAALPNTANVTSSTTDPNPNNNPGPEQSYVSNGADVAVTNTVSPNPVLAGNTVTYTLTVTNNGGSTAQNVNLSDLFPSGTTLVSQSQTGGPAFTLGNTGNQLSDSIASLASGASAVFQVVVKVNSSAPAGTLADTAVASSTTADPNTANNSATAQVQVNVSADVAVTVSGPASPVAGSTATYTITVTNNGPSDAQGVSLSDALPVGTTLVSQSQTSGPAFTLTTNNGNPDDVIGTLAAGESATFQVVAAVPANTAPGTVLTDSASVGSSTPDPVSANNNASTQGTVAASTDLAVTVSGPSNPVAGTTATYTVTVTNNGPSDAQGVSLSDSLPAGTTLVSQSQTSGPAFTLGTSGGNPADSIATLAAGQSATFQVVASLPANLAAGSTLTDSASVGSSTPDPVSANNTARAQTTVAASADLAVTVSGPSSPVAGTTATYTITVSNNGPSDAQAVSLSDSLPPGTTLVSQSQTSGPAFALGTSGGNPADTISTLAAGASATFQVTAAVPANTAAGTTLTDSASVGSSTPDPVSANNNARSQGTVTTRADLAVTVSGPSSPVAGSTATYTVTVKNNGPSDAQGVSLSDALPAGTTLVSQSQTSGPAFTLGTSGGNPADSIATLAAGQSATFQVMASLPANLAPGTTLTDSASVGSSTPDPVSANNSARTQGTVAASTDLAVTVSGPSNPVAGTTATYTVTVTNNGPSDAQGVSLSDSLPAGTTLVSQSQTSGPAFTLGTSGGNPADSIATLAAGQSATFQVVASLPANLAAGSTLTDSASVGSSTPDPVSANNTARAQTTVAASADLAVTVSGPSAPVAGTTATYTITLTNNGPSDAQAVSLSDSLPPGTTLVSQSQTSGPAFTLGTNNGNPADTIGTLASGQSATFQVTAAVPANTAAGTTLTDDASVGSATPDPVSANNSASTQGTVAASADLAVTVSGPSSPVAGSTATYTLTVTNSGPSDAQGVSLSDTLPPGTTLVSQSQTSGPAFALGTTNGNPSDTISTLAAGQSATFQVVVAVPADTPGGTTLTNSATVGSTTNDPVPGNNTANAQGTVVASADLAVTVSGPSAPVAGTTATYTLTLTNNGPSDAQNVSLADSLPTGTTLVSQSQTSGPAFTLGSNNGNPADTIGTLAAGQSATFQVVAALAASIASGTVLTDSATVRSTTPDPVRGNNSASTEGTVTTSADLAVAVSGPSNPVAGTTAIYTVTVTNSGPSDAQNVSLSDSLPAGTTLVSQSQTSGPAFALGTSGGNPADTISTLTAGASATFQVTAAVPANTPPGTVLTDGASVGSTTPDPVSANNSARTQGTVTTSADLAVTVSANPTPVLAGNNLTYTITVSDNGPSDAQNVSLRDLLPPGLTLVSQTQTAGPNFALGNNGNQITDTLATLPAGTTATFQVMARVDPGMPAGTTLTNTPTVSSATTDPVPGNDSATAVVAVATQSELTLRQTVSDPTPNVGDVITFTLTLDNAGPSTATGVTVQDQLPAGLQFVGQIPGAGTSYDPASGTWAVGTLPVGAAAVLQIEAAVLGPAPQTNTATVSHSDQPDPTTPDTASATETPQQAELQVTQGVSDPTPNVGDVVTFTVTVHNGGPGEATGVSLQDLLPPGLSLVGAAPAVGSYDGGTGVWDLGGVPTGASVSLQLQARVNGPAPATNTATLRHADQFDPDPADNSASATVTPQQADLSVTQTVSDPTPSVGEVVTFTITLHNGGPDAATHVVLQDLLPPGLSLVGASAGAGTFSGNGDIWTVSVLPGGCEVVLRLQVRLDSRATLTSEALVVHSDQFDPDPDNNAASVTVANWPLDNNRALLVSGLSGPGLGLPLAEGPAGAGFGPTAPVAFASAAVNLPPGRIPSAPEAALLGGDSLLEDQQGKASISGLVYEDMAGAEELGLDPTPGLAGVEAILTGVNDRGDQVRATTRTDDRGQYSFRSLRPGLYSVTLAPRDDYVPARDSVGTVNGLPVGRPFDDGVIGRIVLPAEGQGVGYDFGEVPAASISGSVYLDDNQDGRREEGLEGVPVTLVGTDDRGRAVRRETTTDADGAYSFGGLRPGKYSVRVTRTEGHHTSEAAVGSAGGTAAERSQVLDIPLTAGARGVRYNFKKVPARPEQGRLPRPGAVDVCFMGDRLSSLRAESVEGLACWSGSTPGGGESYWQALEEVFAEDRSTAVAPSLALLAAAVAAGRALAPEGERQERDGRAASRGKASRGARS